MQPCNPIGYVHSLESFGSVDGPGVRFVVFLQGCALRCKYCHNPETWAAEGGEEWPAEKLFQRVYRYRNYWGKKGGITVSGGEPLRQMEFLTAFFELARSKGVHTALDTAGQPFRPDDPDYLAGFDRLMKSTSLVILDLKEIDPERHRQLTGKDNANILAMARHISDLGIPLWIRHVLVPGLTDDEEGLRRTADIDAVFTGHLRHEFFFLAGQRIENLHGCFSFFTFFIITVYRREVKKKRPLPAHSAHRKRSFFKSGA